MYNRRFVLQGRELNLWVYVAPNGKIWLKAKEIATFLGFVNEHNGIKSHVNDEHRMYWRDLGSTMNAPTWHIRTCFIDEIGLNKILFKSRLPDILQFKKWFLDYVLPSIKSAVCATGFVFLATTAIYGSLGLYKIATTNDVNKSLVHMAETSPVPWVALSIIKADDCIALERNIVERLVNFQFDGGFFKFDNVEQAIKEFCG